MSDKKIKVGVNGYGIIGKRVADAVRLQPDMELCKSRGSAWVTYLCFACR